MSDKKSFEVLHHIDLTNKIKSNQGKRYLPWNTAWAELKKVYPDATYKFHCDENNAPFFNSDVGILVKVSVTVCNMTHTMTRPVYNKSFKSMKLDPYEYTINRGTVKKTVEGANADYVNDALMRCLVKCIAMHGLGLYIYQDSLYAEAELINSSQISEISRKISENDLMLGDLNMAFGINRLSELYEANYESALLWIEDKIKAKKEK